MCLSDIITYINFDEIWRTIFLHWYSLYYLSSCEVFCSSFSQFLLREACCKNYIHNDGIFFLKEVKFLSDDIIWNSVALRCQCLKHTLQFLIQDFFISNTSWREISSPRLDLGNWRPFQLAYDVVTTLGFGCILAATSDNVVTTLMRFNTQVLL